jgi:hypothetical protein
MRHLTDEEIQRYLDGVPDALDSSLRSHLGSCTHCKRAIEAYRMLYAGLEDDRSFRSHPGLASAVVRRLGVEAPARRPLPVEMMLAASGVAAAVVAAVIWLDLGPLANAIAEALSPLAGLLAPSVQSARDYLTDLNHGLTTLLLGITVLLFMIPLDALIPRKRLITPGRRR